MREVARSSPSGDWPRQAISRVIDARFCREAKMILVAAYEDDRGSKWMSEHANIRSRPCRSLSRAPGTDSLTGLRVTVQRYLPRFVKSPHQFHYQEATSCRLQCLFFPTRGGLLVRHTCALGVRCSSRESFFLDLDRQLPVLASSCGVGSMHCESSSTHRRAAH